MVKQLAAANKSSRNERQNYFQALKIYNQALKIYNQSLKIYFQALKIIFRHALRNFCVRRKWLWSGGEVGL